MQVCKLYTSLCLPSGEKKVLVQGQKRDDGMLCECPRHIFV